MNTVLDFVHQGGFFMYPIVLCSVAALAIFLERVWVTRNTRTVDYEFVEEIREMLSRGETKEASALCRRRDSVAGKILYQIFTRVNEDEASVRIVAETVGKTEVSGLSRRVDVLSTIANVSTLLGLLGTISGMIRMFSTISAKQFVNPADLAGGISEALITTAAGLSVAIPSLIFYRFFRGRVDELVLVMEEEALKIVDVMHGDREDSSEQDEAA